MMMMMMFAFSLACQSCSRSGDHLNVWNGLFDCFLMTITIFLGAILTMTVRRWWQYWSQSDKSDWKGKRGSNSDLNSNFHRLDFFFFQLITTLDGDGDHKSDNNDGPFKQGRPDDDADLNLNWLLPPNCGHKSSSTPNPWELMLNWIKLLV